MRLSLKNIYCIVLGIVFSGCADLFFNPTTNLSLVPLSEVRIMPDVSSIAFEWKLNEKDKSIKGFVIYRKAKEEKEFKRIAIIANPFATHFVDKGLKNESIYYYQFATLGANDTISARSKIFAAKTSFIQPLEMAYASKDTPRMIKILWNPHPNPSVNGYIIEKKIDGQWREIAEVSNRLNIEYFDTNLADGSTYEYRVASIDFNGIKGRYSPVVSATTKYPPAPLNNITASKDVPKLIIIKWDASKQSDISHYAIYASQEEKGKYKKVGESKNTYFEFKTEDNGAVWFFKVVGVDEYGIAGSLAQVPVMGVSLTPPPPPVIKGASVVDEKAVIGWETPSSRVSAVYVYRKEGSFGNPLKFRVANNETKFVDKEMEKGKTYTYWVEFVDVNQIPSEPSQTFKLTLP
ncbi:hypothetical protein CQA62_05480 [Helicobacter cholecystus]|uniref:Fibronectin type-III domain-containing protein n=1 Tax=Helicobacter cholecystus TaxID=45498 RepID=A0A3D8IU84_9HELI|nr:fibronectin type III domain-containing protein [Helicobacter cholecystus]RDU68838.1 hypothetical protein CQA62_05480 [Helicobacter cholecystus]VEJ23882.1 putative fibronectin domain-containing lipoprotein [Helicobacter cholecystus]